MDRSVRPSGGEVRVWWFYVGLAATSRLSGRARGETCAHGKGRTENTPKVALVAPGLKKRSRPRGTGGIIRANLVATAREEATTVAAAATTMMNRTLKQ
ncbi:unnamed protein product, partial [Laminaria digitata]